MKKNYGLQFLIILLMNTMIILGQSINVSISSGSDDAEEKGDGSVEITSVDMDLGTHLVGLRFTNITIPQGAIITNAYIQFTADETETESASLIIRGNDTDNANTFTTINEDISSREITTAAVNWTPENWTIGDAGSAQRTPDISEIVQEIIDRDGWSSGNQIAFIIFDNNGGERAADSYEEGTPAQLYVEYTQSVAEATISSGELSLTFKKVGSSGVNLTSIKKNDTELLDVTAPKTLFEISVQYPDGIATYNNTTNWTNVEILPSSDFANCQIEFTRWNLKATVYIYTSGDKSLWDMSVTDIIENRSLLEVKFPDINIKADGNDNLFMPRYDGRVIDNPKSRNINYEYLYPRGWGGTMQYLAYYNNNYGIYLGTHDPSAAIKTFKVERNGYDGLKYEVIIPAPNKGISQNNWYHSGEFAFRLFDGDWFDAANIYKEWVYNYAEYQPGTTTDRLARQNILGNISFWMYFGDPNISSTEIASGFIDFADYLDVPSTGAHWYKWNGLEDENTGVPYVYSPKDGMATAVNNMKNNGITVMPYTNGRLYETDLDSYNPEGINWSAKDENIQPEIWGDYAIMCPTQTDYQNIIVDLNDNLIDNEGTNGTYIDQVCASDPKQCMDASHGHSVGGGNFWRSGYKQLFEKLHSENSNVFVTTEGSADFLTDEVDGFLVESWQSGRYEEPDFQMVPAFQVVYSGDVQLFSSGAASWDSPQFFCKHARALVNGVTPGRISYNLNKYVNEAREDAWHYVKREANIRNELKDFLAFGRIQRPIIITGNNNQIESDWGYDVNITIDAIQKGVWKNNNGNILVIFANASRDDDQTFNFTFVGSDYGLSGNIQRQEFWTNSSTNKVEWGGIYSSGNTFDYFATHNYPIDKMQIRGFIFGQNLQKRVSEEELENQISYNLNQNYPNPFNPTTVISFTIPKAGKTKVEIYNLLGQKVANLLNENLDTGEHNVQFDGSNLTSGIYFYKLSSGEYTNIKKMMLLK